MKGTKNAEERRAEILDVAETLFLTKGYQQTTIIDILEKVGIAKGTFYYYFKSKEEVMDAIIGRIVDEKVVEAKIIARNPELSVLDKIYQILFDRKSEPEKESRNVKFVTEFHNPQNAEIHQKSLVETIKKIAPVLVEVVCEGIDQGILSTDYPQETMELLIVSGQILFSSSWFSWTEAELGTRASAFIQMMETSLGAKSGSFDYMVEILLE